MNDQPVTDALLRQFLLNQVGEEERQRIESLFMTDSVARERVLAAEQELIDDYLDNSLTTEERETFIGQYAATPAQQRKLRIAQSIKHWATTTASETPAAITASRKTGAASSWISGWGRRFESLRLKPAFAVTVAATAIILIVAVALWLKIGQGNGDRRAMEHKIARLNDPSRQNEVPPQTPTLTLSPVEPRSIEPQDEVTLRPDVQVVELRLLWIQKERFPTYRAVVRRVDAGESLSAVDLRAESDGSVRMKLPADSLKRGLYQIELTGITPNGPTGPSEEYTFNVRR